MKRQSRLAAYAFVGAALLLIALAAPATWAAPDGSVLSQTIPTPTPTLGAVEPTVAPTTAPTTAPAQTPQPGATVAPTATAAQSGGGAGGSSTACSQAATLTLVSDRNAVAPGMTVVFTATLTNVSRQPLRQIVLEDQLSAGLEPGEVISGQGTWQDRTLRVTAPTLAAGARLVVVYSAEVAAQPGPVITARASATTAGCPARTTLLTLALPPSELPRTGGSLD